MTDKELIQLYLSNKDENALRVLIDRHLRPVYGLIYTYTKNQQDAEDITQEAFVRAWKHLKKFDHEKNFRTWIFAIAKNAALDFLKKKKTIPFSEFETPEGTNVLLDTLQDTVARIDTVLENKDNARVLAPAIAQLSPQYHTVVSLRYNDHFSFREIAESLHESIDTVKSRHRRALKILRNFLAI